MRMQSRLLSFLSAICLILPTYLYGWTIVSWLSFLCFILLSTAIAPLLVGLRRGFAPAVFVLELTFSTSLFVLFWSIFEWQKLPPLVCICLSSLFAQLLVVLTMDSPLREAYKERDLLQDWGWVLLLCFLTMLFIRGPFAGFGENHGEYLGLPYLMVTDFLGHISHLAELEKGVIPMNTYFGGEVLHYYWFAHAYPASFARAFASGLTAVQLMQMGSLVFSLMVVTVLSLLLRTVTSQTREWVSCVFLLIFFHSYIWLMSFASEAATFLARIVPFVPWQSFLQEKGEMYSGLSHGLLRDFVTEPHGTLAYALVLALVVFRRITTRMNWQTSAVQGMLLGSCFGIEPFMAIVGAAWFFFSELISIGTNKALARTNIYRVLVSAVFCFFVLCFLFRLRMFGGGSGNMTISPYWRMIVSFPLVLALEFGALFFIGCYGIKDVSKDWRRYQDFLVLALVLLPVMFFVQHGYVHNLVFRKSLRLLGTIVVVFCIPTIAEVFNEGLRQWRKGAICCGLIALAVPSLYTDYTHLSLADGSEKSVLFSKEDYRASEWIRSNLPLDAVIQGKPDYGGEGANFTPTIAFGERRAALGDFIRARNYQIGEDRVISRARLIRYGIFGDIGIDTALAAIRELGIDYIYIGPEERRYYGQGISKFWQAPDRFESVYRTDAVTIFRVL